MNDMIQTSPKVDYHDKRLFYTRKREAMPPSCSIKY